LENLDKMTAFLRNSWRSLAGKPEAEKAEADILVKEKPSRMQTIDLNLEPNDALLAYFLDAPGVVEMDRLDLDSPALRKLKEAGVKVAVPLVSQGELIGLLNLGTRLSEQEYTTDDRRLLNTLATQAAPALRVAQLARQQQIEARERERMEQELRVARVIQQTLLPKSMPDLRGWQLDALWQPARAVSGDFYDYIAFPDGQLGLVVGDVTDKGVPAALVMATTRSIFRAALERFRSPGEVLSSVNDLLCPDISPNMFVTCLYILLDPTTGHLRFANAGHNLPAHLSGEGVRELRATGMPLGLMPGMTYEETEAQLQPGDGLVLYSDGLVEAHNVEGEMFGFPHLRALLARKNNQSKRLEEPIAQFLMEELASYTGADWEQEDDVTLVTLEYLAVEGSVLPATKQDPAEETWNMLGEFSLASEPGNELQVMEEVATIVQASPLPRERMERLKTAVAEATMNAMEHGNHYRDDLTVDIQVLASPSAIKVRISDYGNDHIIPEPETPDLEAKLAGLQSPRGWGLFLIKNMVDEMKVYSDEIHHTVELIFKFEEGDQA
jgi:serine phosphatase RsbU (regulator of sigma subunit)/anti-sigma regulatory factor (Ser/Thr protein kinase)